MKKNSFLTLFSILLLISCNTKTEDTYVADHYNKKEVTIAMRDGIKLHTVYLFSERYFQSISYFIATNAL